MPKKRTPNKNDSPDGSASPWKIPDLLMDAPIGFFISTPEGRFIAVNQTLALMYGYETPEAVVASITDIGMQVYSDPDDRKKFKQFLENTGEILNYEYSLRRRDGSGFWASTSVRAIRDHSGKVICFEGFTSDISERRKTQELLIQQKHDAEVANTQWENTFDAVPDPIALIDNNYHIIRANNAMAERINVSRDDITGRICYEVVHGLPKPPAYCPHPETLSTGSTVCKEIFEKELNGFFEMSVTAVHDSEGCFLGSVHVARDITERKDAEKALKEKTELLQHITNNMFDLVSLIDLKGTYKFLGGSHDILGYDPKTLIGRNAMEFIHPDDLSEMVSTLESFLANPETGRNFECRYRRANGGYTWLETAGRLILDEFGNPKEIVLSSRDITLRRKAERKALNERDRYSGAIIETTQDSFLLLDAKGSVIETNEACCRMSGYTKEELLKMHITDLNYDSSNVDLANRIKRIQKKGSALFEFRYLKKDGQLIDVEASTTWLNTNGGKIICFFRDVTQRRQAEAALRRSEEEKTLILNATSELFCYYDLDLRVLWVNKAACDSVNQPPEALFGRHCYELWHERSVPCEGCPALLAKETKTPQQKEIQTPDGKVWLLRSYPIQDKSDSVVAIVEFANDITESKHAEESLLHLNATLEQQVAERTEVAEIRAKQLQALAVELVEAEERERHRIAGLLHDDLQQLIASARMQVQLASEKADPGPIMKNVEKLLEISLEKSRRLSHELSPPVLHQFGLAASLKWLIRHMDDQFELKVQLETEIAPQIKEMPLQIFLFRAAQELLFNCVKHAGVKNANVRLCSTDNEITLSVSDTGQGFNPDILNSFEGKTGLGLRSLRERAFAIGGNLAIKSASGQGSRFALTVPIHLAIVNESEKITRVKSSTPETLEKPMTISGSEIIKVLFADDHKVMRQGLIGIIADQPGIQLAGEATDGEEALALARQLKPDVIIMDVSMPKMDGIEATRRIKNEMPEVRVIGLSMFEDEDITQKMYQAGADGFVSKSESSAKLLRAIYKLTGTDMGE